MAVLRGSGPAGLGAMAAESGGVPASGVPIVRPLLGITRAEVEGYLAERGLSYTTDSSNSDTRFLRNRIRRLLVPLLDREFPHWQAPLLSLNKTQAGIAGFLASEASRRLPWKQEGESLFLGEKDFFAQSFAIREEALFQALDTLSRGPLSPTAVSVAASGFAAPGDFRPRRAALKPFIAGKKAACDLGPFRLEKKGGRITAGPGTVFHRAFSVLIKNPGLYKLETLTLRSLPDTMTERPVSSCGFFASFPLIVRSLERKERVEVRDRDGRAVIVSLQGEIIWVRKRGSRNGSCIVVETAAQKPAGE
jgi:tRNA(Ile)-lysidine synthase